MLEKIEDRHPHPQKLEQGEVAPYTHCVAHSKSYFKNPPTPYTILYHNDTNPNIETPPGAK